MPQRIGLWIIKNGSVSSSGSRGGRGRDTSQREHGCRRAAATTDDEGGPRGGSNCSRSLVSDVVGCGAQAQGSRGRVHVHGRGDGGVEGFGRVPNDGVGFILAKVAIY